MKKIFTTLLMTSALFAAGLNAQTFDDFADFGDFGGASDFSEGGFSAASKLEVNGKVSADVRAYVDTDDKDKVQLEAKPAGKLDLSYSGNNSDLLLSLCLDEDKIKNNPDAIIDELLLRGRLGDYLTLEAGKMKLVWGKGDKLHVLDNFNADDYSDFIIPDYIDRRVSTPMLRAVVSAPLANLNIEGVYTPLLPVDRFATSGRWTPAQVNALTAAVTASAKAKVASAFTDYTAATAKLAIVGGKYQEAAAAYQANPTNATAAATFAAVKTAYEAAQTEAKTAGTLYMLSLENANSLSAKPESLYPDLLTLKYGQFGGRATWTLGQVDMGLSYYNGWYKQPSFNAEKMNSYITKYLAGGSVTEDDKFLAYDKKQTFGIEASSIIWHFNVRGEFAYNLTEDLEGTDPWVHNNSIAWLGGFDIDLPFWNANLNLQETGAYILKGEECDKNSLDVDYGKNGYSNNKLVANLTASFLNDKVLPELTVMYGFENKDLVVMPKLSYKVDQNLTLLGSGMIINCGDDNSEFKAWEKNSFASLGAEYHF